MSWFRPLILLCIAITLAAARLAHATPACVREHLPELKQAFDAKLSPDAVELFFEKWTDDECLLFLLHLELIRDRIGQGRLVPNRDTLYLSHGVRLFGALGEVYGNAHLRASLQANRSEQWISDWEYDLLNPRGNKPDGVAFYVSNDALVLTQILESKLGGATFSSAQATGYLNTWQETGFTIYQWGEKIHFPPTHIFVELANELKHISQVTELKLRELTTLVGTSPHRQFKGNYLLVPFDATTGRSVIYEFLANFSKTLPAGRKAPEHPLPVIGPEALPDFVGALIDFILERNHWPRAGSKDGLEKLLAKEVSNRGGQATVFHRDLNGGLRHFLTVHEGLPAIVPMENKIRSLAPSDPAAISVIRAYVRRYAKKQDPIPLIEELKRKNSGWRDYFAQHPESELRHAVVEELNSCLELILDYQTRKN